MLNEFKNFIARGNVIDLAVGMIIGAAFTSIVKSLVDDVIMPVIGVLTNGIDFSDLYINLSGTDYASLKAAQDAGAATVNYGLFINASVHFLIVATVIFFMVKAINKVKDQADDTNDKKVRTPKEILLLTEIRDLLASEKSTGTDKT